MKEKRDTKTTRRVTTNVLAVIKSAVKRQDDLRAAEMRRVNQIEALRSKYQEKLAAAEAKRIDAIRAIDVAAVAVASERATQRANVLASQVASSAEALRALVATTATPVANQLQQISTQFTERLAALEKAHYESKGKSGVTDLELAELMTEMRNVVKVQSSTAGKAEGISASWGVIVGAVGVLVAVITVGAMLLESRAVPAPYIPGPPAQTAPR